MLCDVLCCSDWWLSGSSVVDKKIEEKQKDAIATGLCNFSGAFYHKLLDVTGECRLPACLPACLPAWLAGWLV